VLATEINGGLPALVRAQVSRDGHDSIDPIPRPVLRRVNQPRTVPRGVCVPI
jgi:hypothetical protein